MRVMLDNSIEGHSQFADSMKMTTQIQWGGAIHASHIAGFVRKKIHPDSTYQAEIDALFTIGRLIRNDYLQAFTYNELRFEGWRRVIGEVAYDALAGCEVKHCAAPLERSRFFQTSEFFEYVSKGGKKDRKAGKNTSMSQSRFVEWLLGLTNESILKLISLKDTLNITDFEIDSLGNIDWFRAMCRTAQSPENYPDMLHLWAAQRNSMDIFLTLEKRLPNIVIHFPKNETCCPTFPTQVLRPLELMTHLGITELDPVPIKPGRFYPMVGDSIPISEADIQGNQDLN
jgi:hypothetical protein